MSENKTLEEEIKDRINKIFWDYLHTIVIANDNVPNEPHRQVIFKEEIPEIIEDSVNAILSLVVVRLEGLKKELLPLSTDYRFGKVTQHGIRSYNQAIVDCIQAIRGK